MTTWAISLFWIFLGLAIVQAAIAWRFVRVLKETPPRRVEDSSCPKAAVVLCLRGPDPFLPACLEAVLNLDYPHYDLHVVVDSRDDPAWAIAEQAIAAHGGRNVHMKPLTTRRATCSLKCSSLVQAISELDDSYKVLALLDADTIPHRTWLRELAAPLAEDRVAAATGNRWYVPGVASWGSLVRRLWNAAAVVQMFWFKIPWGGTLALKLDVVRRSNLLERWGNALCEDTMLYAALRPMGYRVAFVPSLMMINREGCDLESFFRWVRRQLLTARLYHPAWGLVVGHGLGTAVVQLAGIVALVAAVLLRNWPAGAWLVAGAGSYWGVMVMLLAVLEDGVRHTAQPRGESIPTMRVSTVPRLLAAMALTQAVYPAALLSSILLRVVDWRGIRYRVEGPTKIRMIEYVPYGGEVRSESESL